MAKKDNNITLITIYFFPFIIELGGSWLKSTQNIGLILMKHENITEYGP